MIFVFFQQTTVHYTGLSVICNQTLNLLTNTAGNYPPRTAVIRMQYFPISIYMQIYSLMKTKGETIMNKVYVARND